MKLLFAFIFCLIVIENIDGKVIPITLEHARTDKEVQMGLMGRTTLPQNHGMLFYYPMPRKLSFWMYNTLIDLSVAFLDEHQVIREIYELKSYPHIQDKTFFLQNSVSSTFEAKYALEMNKNWFDSHNVKPGSQVIWDPTSQKGYIFQNF